MSRSGVQNAGGNGGLTSSFGSADSIGVGGLTRNNRLVIRVSTKVLDMPANMDSRRTPGPEKARVGPVKYLSCQVSLHHLSIGIARSPGFMTYAQ